MTASDVNDLIADGTAGADLIAWNEDRTPNGAINAAVSEFTADGWIWDGRDLTRGGWMAWFRSQGNIAPPIITWRLV